MLKMKVRKIHCEVTDWTILPTVWSNGQFVSRG